MSTLTFDSAAQAANRDRALRAIDSLPPFSPILNRLLATLADENISFAKVGALIEKDTVLSANILRVVNSAAYNCRGTVNSVPHAVAIMGLRKLRNTALALSVNRLWRGLGCAPGWSMADFNLHSLATAILSDLLAQKLDVNYPEGAFVSGLFHDLGKLLVATSTPGGLESLVRLTLESPAREDMEQQALGVTHADLSAAALERWNLPRPIQIAVAFHHEPGSSPRDAWGEHGNCLAELVNRADAVVNNRGISLIRLPPQEAANDPASILRLLDPHLDADQVMAAFDRDFGAVQNLF